MFKKRSRNYPKKEQSPRFSLLPLAFILMITGIVLLFFIMPWPVKYLTLIPLPFIVSTLLKKYVLIVIGLLNILFGIGLLFRSRLIWRLFLAYLILGPAWLILGMIFGHFPHSKPKTLIILFSLLIWAGLGSGLYLLTKPAFPSRKKKFPKSYKTDKKHI